MNQMPDMAGLERTLDTMLADGALTNDEAMSRKLALRLVYRVHDFMARMNQNEPGIETLRFRLTKLLLPELVFSFRCHGQGVWISHEDLEGGDQELAQDMLVDLNSTLLGLDNSLRDRCLEKAFIKQGERYLFPDGQLHERLQSSIGADGWAYHEKLGLDQHTPMAMGSPGRGRRL